MLELYAPERAELWFRRALLADEETMSYNRAWGGTVDFPEEDWDDWYDWWVLHPEGKRFYRYLRDEDGAFVGEIAYHFDRELGGFIANVIVRADERGKGYGAQGLELLCAAAKERGIGVLWDDIAEDNPAIGLFLRRGFTPERREPGKIILKKEL